VAVPQCAGGLSNKRRHFFEIEFIRQVYLSPEWSWPRGGAPPAPLTYDLTLVPRA
jgi:hypothetical protein